MKFSRSIALVFLSAVLLAFAHRPAEAKDEWLQVRSKNFFLIGNASEKDIRKVGAKLEQFRETFRQLFRTMNLTSSIPTNVIVFKSNSYYKNFKPKRADGKIDNFIAGYFQPGEDVNYITLSTEGEDSQTYGTIFHEYVHFVIETNFGKSEVPPWFNEGLAEYYQTFAIVDDQKAKLGLPQGNHLAFLQQNKFIPLDQLFRVTNYQLHQTADHSRSIFYAESWALMHYLIQGGKSDALNKFLSLALKDTPPETAFKQAFGMTYAQMESDLRKYVGQATYKYVEVTFKTKLLFETEMQTSPMDDADFNAYVGDLLFHTNRADDAEAYLLASLKLKPESSMANTTLGMVKMKQRKFDEAKVYLEKAIADDQKNHLAFYRYAYLLSRGGRDEFGYVREFDKQTAAKMRDALKKAIAINPAFTESYELLAFVNLVNSEELDESVALLQKALKYQPGSQRYALRIAEIYLRQGKVAEAGAIAGKIAQTADDPNVKTRAESLSAQIAQRKEFDERQEAELKQYEDAIKNRISDKPMLTLRNGEKRAMTDEELSKEADVENLRTINRALRKPVTSEKRVVGYLQHIDCKNGVIFTVKTDRETFALVSKDFESLALNAFVPITGGSSVGCDASNITAVMAVITYKERAVPNSGVRGDLTAIEFVPEGFRIMSEDELNKSIAIDVSNEPIEKEQQAAIARVIRQALNQARTGEKREFGYLEKIECTKEGSFFNMRTADGTFRLFNSSPAAVQIRLFTRDLEGMQFGCAMKPIDIPVVFIYKERPDAKAKSAGEIVSLDFVPKSFTLE